MIDKLLFFLKKKNVQKFIIIISKAIPMNYLSLFSRKKEVKEKMVVNFCTF